MSWLTVIWSMAAAACLTLASMHGLIWFKQRSALHHLLFSLAAIGVAGVSGGELAMLRSQTPEQFALALRYVHIPMFIVIVSLVAFVRVYFGTGRTWLMGAIWALRALILIINFVTWPNFNFRAISSLSFVRIFRDETAAIGVGVPSPWTLLGLLSSLLLLAFVIDASISLWRRGGPRDRLRAVRVGGSLTFFVTVAVFQSQLVLHGFLRLPYLISFPFLVPLMVMGYELGSDIVRTSRLLRELQTSRDELKTSNQRMDLAYSAADLGLWEWDINADRVWLSDRAREMGGMNGDSNVNLTRFLAALHPDDRDHVRDAMRKSVQTGSDYEAEFRMKLQDGSVQWLASRGKVQLDGASKPALMRGVSIDITRRRQAEERFRLVVEAAPNAMIMVSPQGTMTLVNAQTEAIFGYSRYELVGRAIEMLLPERFRAAHPELRAAYFADAKKRIMGAGRELFGLRKDGSEVPLEIGLNPIESAEGMYVVASITDITRRRQAERDAAQQRDELAHLSRVNMLGELSGSLAHELNQPLTAILSNAQAAQRFLANKTADVEEVQEILRDIIDADHRAGDTIHRLRLLFKKGEVTHQSIDINLLVREVLTFLNSDLINNRVSAVAELQPNLPMVQIDRVQIQQVLINLIMNACDAMGHLDGGPRELRVRTAKSQDGEVQLSIHDNGCGIPSEQLEKVFEPFVTTKSKGMGMGLAVCRTIVTAHGGRLWATNNSGAGATLHLTLAVADDRS